MLESKFDCPGFFRPSNSLLLSPQLILGPRVGLGPDEPLNPLIRQCIHVHAPAGPDDPRNPKLTLARLRAGLELRVCASLLPRAGLDTRLDLDLTESRGHLVSPDPAANPKCSGDSKAPAQGQASLEFVAGVYFCLRSLF